MAAAVALFVTATVKAAEKTHDGKIVSVTEGIGGKDGKLVMSDKDNKEHSHAVPATAKITLNNKSAKLGDLKKGDAVKVTTGDNGEVTAIAATRSA
jgi:formylmethanofuran dehydrogenase subunit D